MCAILSTPGTQRPHARGPGSLAEWRVEFSFLVYTISKNALAVRKISYPDVFEFHVALSAGVQLQGDLAIE
jgi:hypothetical protein